MIEGTGALREMVEAARAQGVAAVDTELVWERTFYARLGLVQLALSRDECYLVDVPAIGDLGPLKELLEDEGTVKIFHDATQDLTILRRATGAAPRNIFDSQTASGFAGLTSTISLRDLVQELVGVELHKSETRTDWMQRPLTETQVKYAEEDVRYLPEIRLLLLERAGERQVRAWLEEEMAGLDRVEMYEERDPREQFRRVKGSGRLNPRQLAVLREVAAWRESEARSQDRPRGRIASDKLLMFLAQRQPQTIDELAEVRSFRRRELEAYGEGLLKAVAQGLGVAEADRPVGSPRSRYDRKMEQRVDSALEVLKERSAAIDIDHALVATRAEVNEVVRNGDAGEAPGRRLLEGWRAEFIGRELAATNGSDPEGDGASSGQAGNRPDGDRTSPDNG